jgi:mannitol/fructose-specific phosphotransferase system IIA component
VGRLPAELPDGVLAPEAVRLAQTATDKVDALRQSGRVLVEIGAVEPGYADAILEREEMVSTFVGEGVAIPHGTNAAKGLVHRTALGFLQFPGGVDWGEGATVRVCIPIAAAGGEHMALLSALAMVLLDPEQAERLRSATSAEGVLAVLEASSDSESDDDEAGHEPGGELEGDPSATEGVSR